MAKKRMLTGYRPTGRMHLGHWHGNLTNMLAYQHEYECFFFIADWHALTSEYADPSEIRRYGQEIVLDWVAAGLDPEAVAIYRQSDLPEVAELYLYLQMITPLGWLERVPTYKEQQQQLSGKDLSTIGFLGYPLLQAADITIVRSEIVPVGEDQVPHLEFTREVVRRFHYFYGECFPEPEALISEAKRVPGTDGRKMSKSYDNAVYLSDPPETVKKKIMSFMTDPARKTRSDSGDPDVCPLNALHKLYDEGELAAIEDQCRTAEIGCVDHKKVLAAKLVKQVEEFQERRAALGGADQAEEILAGGLAKAKSVVTEVMGDVRRLTKVGA